MQNKIYLKADCLDTYSLAIYNNSIPLIDEVKIINEGETDLKNIELEISSYPSFFTDFVKKIDILSSTRYIIINPHDLEIDLTKVMYSVAPTNSVISIKLKSLGETISEVSKSVSLLPYDYISPINDYTELLSAFVTPNQEDIKTVVPMVLDCIKKDFDIPINQDMWDYSDKKMTSSIIKSIYNAVCGLKITFNTYGYNENKPTKIKLPESVLLTKNATGLEIALLTSSVAELLGINTFLIFAQEKVLIGFFYGDQTFDTCVSDDSRVLECLIDGCCETFAIVDTTSMINGTSVSFESSSLTAQKALDSCDFPIVVDIKRCRNEGYLPLPSRIKQNGNLIFDISSNNKNVNIAQNSDILKSADTLCKSIKDNLSDNLQGNSLVSFDKNSTLYLIGGGKLIINKLIFNGKIFLKNFPIENKFDDSIFDKLVQLNQNIDDADLSGTINTFHDKNSFLNTLSAISDKSKDELACVCVSLGTLVYKFNGKTMCAPLLLSTVSLENDTAGNYSLKINSDSFVINPCLTGLLKQLYIQFDISKYQIDLVNSYSNLLNDLINITAEEHDVKIHDISCLSVFKTENHILSNLATPEFFNNSTFLNNTFENKKETFSAKSEFSPVDLPFSLDSSQTRAISDAENNFCSIIEGPNGSGKTLCAVSLAFSALRRGEKVLYLSNSDSNIKAFLELADNASFSKHIMKILDGNKTANSFESLNTISYIDNNVNSVSEQKDSLLSDISESDAYYESLHNVKEIGFSLYEVVSQYERYRSFPYSVSFTNEEVSRLNRDDVVTWFDAISSLSKAGSDCKEPHGNPLFFIKSKNFSYDLKSKAVISLNRHTSVTEKFIYTQNALGEFLGVEMPIMQEAQTENLLKLAECALNQTQNIYYGAFLCKDFHESLGKIENLLLRCEDIFELKDFLSKNFTEDVIHLDCDELLSEWRNANSKFAFAKSSALSTVRSKLKAYCLNPKFITNDNFVDSITKLSRYKDGINLIENHAKTVFEITGIDINTQLSCGNVNVFAEIKAKTDIVSEFLNYIDDIYESEQKPDKIYSHCFNIFKNPDKLKTELEILFTKFKRLYNEYKESEEDVVNSLELDILTAKEENCKIWYYFVTQFFDKIIENIDLLKYWCKWNIEKEKCSNLGLSNVVKLYESEQISAGDIKNAFLKGFFKSVSEYFLSCDNNTNNFSSENRTESEEEILTKIKTYRKLLKEDLNKKINFDAKNYLDNNIKISSNEAEAILRNKYSYNFALGNSIDEENLLQAVKPCFVCNSSKFLMKFTQLPKFDLVIVDSDYKSVPYSLFLLMPLTKRFVYTQNSSTEFSKILCGAGASLNRLNWFYNSNFTCSLVNDLFYDNKLSLVPLMSHPRQGVNIVKQLGKYERKKTRVNVIEASAVVDEIIKYLSDSSKKTIGVYTMTSEQKKLVELLLQKRMGSALEKYSNDNTLVIKSFVNAEYEPRDIVIFSTVFSQEEHSKYKQSITKTIPELSKYNSIDCLINILTSVKSEFALITSLSEESLDNFKTTEKNYCIFKKTLRRLFDVTNSRIQEINNTNSLENSIIRHVAGFIESLGYKADLYVGANNSKVDIAIKPKGASNYLLGIIFDETAYINSDNYFGRNLILANLKDVGKWKILRIHTIEWFENQNKQLDRITNLLKNDNFENSISINK